MKHKDPCDFSIQEEYLTIPKVKAGESLKEKAIEHFGPSGIEKINNGPTLMSPKMCVGCKGFTNSKNGVGWCELHEAARLERDYPLSNCFQWNY